MGKIFTNDPPFYQQLRAIAIPVAVQNLITVGVSMLDTLMLGSMGEVQLSASSLANQWFFMLTVINFGLAGGANVLVAQYWGKGEPAEIRKVLSIVYRISVCISLLFSLGALCCPEIIMSIFTNDAEVIARPAAGTSLSSAGFTPSMPWATTPLCCCGPWEQCASRWWSTPPPLW